MTIWARRSVRYLTWFLLSLFLVVLLLLTTVSTFLATESGSQWLTRWGLQQLAEMEDINVEVRNIRGNLLQGLQLQEVIFSGAGVEVDAQSITASWNPYSLFSGTFQLSELHLDELDLRVQPGESPDQAASNPLAEFSMAPLPIGIAINDFTLSSLRISSAGQEFEIDALNAAIALQGIGLNISALHFAMPEIQLDGDIELQLIADLPLSANLDWRYLAELPMDLGTAMGRAELAGSVSELQVNHELQAPFSIRSRGSVLPFAESGPELDLRHQAARISLPLEGQPIAAEAIDVNTRGGLQSLQLNLSANLVESPVAPVQLSAQAELTREQLNLNNLRIETGSGRIQTATVIDLTDTINLSGDFEIFEADPLALLAMTAPASIADLEARGSYQLQLPASGPELALQLQSAQFLMDDYPLSANGRLQLVNESIQIEALELRSTANTLNLSGRYEDELQIAFNLDAPQLQQFVPGVSAIVNAQGTISGNPQAPVIAVELDAENIQAEQASVQNLRARIDGDGQNYRATVDLAQADINSGDTPIAISTAQAEFSGRRESHQLELQVNSEQGAAVLQLQGGFTTTQGNDWAGQLRTARLDSAAGTWRLRAPGNIQFRNSGLQVASTCWTYAEIQLCFELDNNGQGRYTAEGSLNQFPLSEFNEVEDREPLLALAQIPRLPQGVSLRGNSAASIYAEFGGDQDLRFNFSASSDNTVLTILSNIEDEYGALTTEEELITQEYNWRRLAVRGNLEEGAWTFDARAQLATENVQDSNLGIAGNLQAQLSISEQGQLAGDASAEFDDLGWIAAFATDLSQVSGNLTSELQISGDLEQPLLAGEVRVNEAALHVERLGITYSDLEFQLVSQGTDRASLEGSIASGDGYLTFDGSASGINSDNWQLTANLDGSDFQLAGMPDLIVDISPQLTLDANPSRIHLGGSLDVPLLDLTVRQLPESAVDISRDVVIVNFPEDRPELGRSYTSTQTSVLDLPLTADFQLTFGEQVAFRGFGLEASLSGGLEIQQTIAGNNITYGELQITEGGYEMYGQRLELREGKLLFLGNYNNPALDIRAVREVEDQTVGVLINGTLKNMRSELFSTPSLPESDILAVLVTGRPFSELQSSDGASITGAIASLGIRQSRGLTDQVADRFGLDSVAITSTGDIDSSELTVGKYLTPDVFIRYGVGLFDSTSKVAVDYLINDRLTLQAESGEYQSIDFTYRVER